MSSKKSEWVLSNDKPASETLEALLERLGIEHYDWLLVGDGSGSGWKMECGWGCVSIERSTLERRAWYGAMSAGTVNFAEMMAYLQPLCWYVSREMQNRAAGCPVEIKHVHIVTDSQYVQKTGESSDPLAGKNGPLWQLFSQFGAQGLMLHWHWVPRETVELNKFSDKLSKAARLNLKGQPLVSQVEEIHKSGPRTIYEFNPCE